MEKNTKSHGLLFGAYLALIGSVLIPSISQATTQPITIETTDGLKLGAVLTMPEQAVKGVVLILQGSGSVGIDGDVSGPFTGTGYRGQAAKLSDQLAESLSRQGFVSLRYAKRGVEDPKQLSNQTLPFLLKDAESALIKLKSMYPLKKVFIVGHSEGALIAALLTRTQSVDAIFLLSLLTRSADDAFSYQFFGWPVELVKNRLDPQNSGMMDRAAFQKLKDANLPWRTVFESMGNPVSITWSSLDANQDGKISISNELVPLYQKVELFLRGLLNSPGFSAWYQSLQQVPAFSKVAKEMNISKIYLYHGMEDAQIRWNWVVEDSYLFKVAPTIRLFPHLGHAFAPMDGALGEMKTSGPFGDEMMTQLTHDLSEALK